MTKRRLFWFSLIMYFSVSLGKAQIKYLRIGDELPGINLGRVFNAEYKVANTASWRGQAMVLDFGSIYCHDCMISAIRFNSLQREFKGKVQFFWIVSDSAGEIEEFLRSSKASRLNNIPIIAVDSNLKNRFKYVYTPHEVWIDKVGRVGAFTDEQSVDSNRLSEFLKGSAIRWAMKEEQQFDYSKGILGINKSIDSSMASGKIYSTTFTNHINGVSSRYLYNVDSLSGDISIHMINESILDLYNNVFMMLDKNYHFYPTHLVLTVKSPSKIIYDAKETYLSEWRKKYTYCYEVEMPGGRDKKFDGERLLNDLNFYFRLKGRVLKMNRVCWVIKNLRPATHDEAYRRQGQPSEPIEMDNVYPLSGLVYWLNERFECPPVVNETDWDAELSRRQLFLVEDLIGISLAKLKEILANYGLTVVVEKRVISVLALSD